MTTTIERTKTLSFYTYSDSLQRVRPENPYRLRGTLNLGFISEQECREMQALYEKAREMLEAPQPVHPHEFKIAVVGQHAVFTSSPMALEILERMVALNEKTMTQAGVSKDQAEEFTQGAKRFLAQQSGHNVIPLKATAK